MKYQIHQQSVVEPQRTLLIAEGDPSEVLGSDPKNEYLAEFIHNWLKAVSKRHPLKEEYEWLIASEDSEYFVLPLEGT